MRSILLIKTSSLGDIVHNLPVVSDIHARFPDAVIDWVVEESFSAIPKLHPAVRNIIPIALRRWRRKPFSAATWREMAAFKRTLQQENYDLILDTQSLVKSGLIAHFAKGKRAGYAAEIAREPLAAYFYDETFVIPKNLHAVDRYRWLAAAAFAYEPNLPLDYGIVAPDFNVAVNGWMSSSNAANYCVLLTATSRADKLWPETAWVQLGRVLNEQGLACILPSGNAEETARAHRIAAQLPNAIAAPPLPLDAIAQLLAQSQLVVGLDTGLSHLAAALGTPVVAIFCSTDPAETGVHADKNVINLGNIGAPPSVDEVVIATLALTQNARSTALGSALSSALSKVSNTASKTRSE